MGIILVVLLVAIAGRGIVGYRAVLEEKKRINSIVQRRDVEAVTAGETRISLAFNTFLKGTIGDNRMLTELKND